MTIFQPCLGSPPSPLALANSPSSQDGVLQHVAPSDDIWPALCSHLLTQNTTISITGTHQALPPPCPPQHCTSSSSLKEPTWPPTLAGEAPVLDKGPVPPSPLSAGEPRQPDSCPRSTLAMRTLFFVFVMNSVRPSLSQKGIITCLLPWMKASVGCHAVAPPLPGAL